VFQIIFNTISAAEISQLDTVEQLELLSSFKVTPEQLENPDGKMFGRVEREGKELYRYRIGDYRIYFSMEGGNVIVYRVLHRNTFSDFLYRSTQLPVAEDEELGKSRGFWKLIEAAEKAKRV
jgi:mRNA-degrading endonuclease RelE of RelBE toxin-antitoxin system